MNSYSLWPAPDGHEISQSVAVFKVTRINQEVDKTGIRRSQFAVLLSYEWTHAGDLMQSAWDNLAISCHLETGWDHRCVTDKLLAHTDYDLLQRVGNLSTLIN